MAADLGAMADEAVSSAVAAGATVHDVAASLGVTYETAQQLVAGELQFSRFLLASAAAGTLPDV